MTTREKIEITLLKALLAADGTPMPDAALRFAGMSVHPMPPLAEVKTAIAELESDEYIAGVEEKFVGRSWTLTTKGTHKAQQL